MGNAPSTCSNRYDGTITKFLVTYPGGTLNPLANPNGTFTLYDDTTYNVTFTIHTQAESSNNDAFGGTTWFDDNVFGYYNGVCYPGRTGTNIGPSQDVTITMNGLPHPCCSGYMVYHITFATLTRLQQPVAFRINWQPAPTTKISTTTDATNATASANVTTSASTISAAVAATETSSASSTVCP